MGELWAHPPLLDEPRQLLSVLRRSPATGDLRARGLAAAGARSGQPPRDQAGLPTCARSREIHPPAAWTRMCFDEPSATVPLFVTLERAETEYSPTTMYEELPAISDRVHWESQISTAPHTPVGRRTWIRRAGCSCSCGSAGRCSRRDHAVHAAVAGAVRTGRGRAADPNRLAPGPANGRWLVRADEGRGGLT